ncbi:glucose dehydrogenase [FAD, quinone]-like [Bombyx mandarina]|uniref:Glucose dehydrogenase [FAD, quinone]-like n=1 Tax=Bombyx mandarina TaxID=7092 RepID=A0A6J2K047_BOMMA|nr:glucose dehydrogenase [FAD, quinone]-like [Bombyx mandarina]
MILAPEECGCPLIEEGVSIENSPICSGTLLFMVLLEGYIRGRCKIATPCANVRSAEQLDARYDFIVVGSGPAGAIVAGRLSEDKNFNVLLLEAGGQEPTGARIPSFYRAFWSNKEVDWDYRTEPDNYCLDQGDKGCPWPRGKVLGGSSLLNGMMYHRGHAADYDDWVKLGAEGWSWEENLPYFDMTEGNKEIGTIVSQKHHSSSGPLPVQRFRYQGPAVYKLLDALNETGFSIIADMNDPETPDGFTIAQAFNDNGQRYTTARAYLKPKSERPNLTVKLGAHVTRVIVTDDTATGVEFIDSDGNSNIVYASREVILSAGALNTPHILLHSGIGPRETLEKYNIPVKADLPVGLNLQNHVGVTVSFILPKLNDTRVLDWSTLATYLLNQEGPMASTSITQVTGLLYSSLADKRKKQPDLQFFFNGMYAECSKTGFVGETIDSDCQERGTNITANAVALLPKSKGYLTLQSSDPLVSPLFYPNFFSHPDDMIVAKDGLRYLKKISESKILESEYGIELDPEATDECSETSEDWSDDWMECMIRLHTDAQNHQLGTTAIGLVVDPQLKVYGIEGLRVIDASVMPSQPTGNPQAAIMMVAERGAAFIKDTHS